MGPCYLSPDDTDVRFLLGVRNGGLVLGLPPLVAGEDTFSVQTSNFSHFISCRSESSNI